MKIIYVDTETTGISTRSNALIQVAGTISADGKTEDFNFTMKPWEGAVIDPGAMKVNGITNFESLPTEDVVFKEFLALLGRHVNRYDHNDKFQIIGYNIEFDVDFLRAWFKRNQDDFFSSWFWNPSLDVMTLAAWHLIGARPDLKNFKLGTVYEYFFGKPMIDAHDAFGDITATREILNEIFKRQKAL